MLVLDATEGALQRLSAALDAAAVASVVIAPVAGRPLDAATTAPLVTATQKAGAAALISGDARLARTLKADGVHLPLCANLEEAYNAARELISQRFIVGVDAGASRHDAMTAGESGADYFGFALVAAATDDETAQAERLDLIAWWSEIFEVPSVAFDVATASDAGDLAAAGADFIAVHVAAGASPASVRELIAAMSAAIAATNAPANS